MILRLKKSFAIVFRKRTEFSQPLPVKDRSRTELLSLLCIALKFGIFLALNTTLLGSPSFDFRNFSGMLLLEFGGLKENGCLFSIAELTDDIMRAFSDEFIADFNAPTIFSFRISFYN